MFSENIEIKDALEDFSLTETSFPYYSFVVRLYNYCRSLGFEPGKTLPSRAFCSDENQAYPNILIAKQFGAFPFNHGTIGGIVATECHDALWEHGKDLVIIHASHVGYDPESCAFGTYHRRQTMDFETTSSCGKISSVLKWYIERYNFARKNIFLHRNGDDFLVSIDNQILNEKRNEGLFLNLDKFLESGCHLQPLKAYSTSKCYRASSKLRELLGDDAWPSDGRQPIGEKLHPKLFGFKRNLSETSHSLLENNLVLPMPWIVSSRFPLLTAAKANTQVEFDRTYRTLANSEKYVQKRVVFISGLNIDISPRKSQVFPLTTFVPWAAYFQDIDGNCSVMEQNEIVNHLLEQPDENPHEIDLEMAIEEMKATRKSSISNGNALWESPVPVGHCH